MAIYGNKCKMVVIYGKWWQFMAFGGNLWQIVTIDDKYGKLWQCLAKMAIMAIYGNF